MFVLVAVVFHCAHWAERYCEFQRWSQDHRGGDQVPDFFGDDVGGEEVEFIDGVWFLDQIVAGFPIVDVLCQGWDSTVASCLAFRPMMRARGLPTSLSSLRDWFNC